MEFFPLSTGPSSSIKGASEAKVKLKETDLLRQVGECDDEESLYGVDCRLSLGLPSSAVDHGRRPGPAPAFTGVRTCLMCGKTETPLWRNGPNGVKSLCNACGIRFKKEKKRASLMLQGKPDSSSDAMMQSTVP